MKFIYSPILVLAAALVAVKADREKEMVDKIYNIVCKDPEIEHPPEWYKCISCCQAMEPFYSRFIPTALTRALLVPNAQVSPDRPGIPFSWTAQKIMCGNMVEYGTFLKNIIIDVKGPMKPETSTSAGMTTFYEEKTACFSACDTDDARPQTHCPPFTSNPSAPGRPDALNYYRLYKKHGSSAAVARALTAPCYTLPITDSNNCRKKYTSKYGWS